MSGSGLEFSFFYSSPYLEWEMGPEYTQREIHAVTNLADHIGTSGVSCYDWFHG